MFICIEFILRVNERYSHIVIKRSMLENALHLTHIFKCIESVLLLQYQGEWR